MDHTEATESGHPDNPTTIPAPAMLLLTDANVTLVNDSPTAAVVSFSNAVAVDNSFPTSLVIPPTSVSTGKISATADPHQSQFTFHFASGEAMVVEIGSGAYSTSATPSILKSGAGGAILAPGQPFSNGSDYDFFFFNGPGICTPLADGLIKVWLPLLIDSVAKKPLTLYTNSANGVTVDLTGLKVADNSSVGCAYASISSQQGANGESIMLNSLFNIDNVIATFSVTIKDVPHSLSVQVQDLMIYFKGSGDLGFATPPTVDALKFSLGSYNISGTFVDVLKTIAPFLYELLTGGIMDSHRLAGLLNTTYNANIINALNKIIQNQLDSIKPSLGQFMSASEGKMTSTTMPSARTDAVPDNGLNNWMSNATIQAMTLGKVKLPGTHDSPTYVLEPVLSPIMNQQLQILKRLSPGPGSSIPGEDPPIYVGQPLYDFILGQGVNCAARAQDTTITTQLANGIRYFDLRLYYDAHSDSFNYQHTIAGAGFSGILDEFATFLQTANTTELVFVLVSDTNFANDQPIMASFASLIKSKISPSNIYCPSSDLNYKLTALAGNTISSITNGSSKIMFMFADSLDYAFTDTVVSCTGFPQNPWKDRMETVENLEDRERPINPNNCGLWGVRWSLDADLTLLPQFVINRLEGVAGWISQYGDNWLLQYGAQLANSALPGFLQTNGGANAQFNLLTCDWFEAPVDVAKMVVNMNYGVAPGSATSSVVPNGGRK